MSRNKKLSKPKKNRFPNLNTSGKKRSTRARASNQVNKLKIKPSTSRTNRDDPNCPCCIDYWLWGARKIEASDCDYFNCCQNNDWSTCETNIQPGMYYDFNDLVDLNPSPNVLIDPAWGFNLEGEEWVGMSACGEGWAYSDGPGQLDYDNCCLLGLNENSAQFVEQQQSADLYCVQLGYKKAAPGGFGGCSQPIPDPRYAFCQCLNNDNCSNSCQADMSMIELNENNCCNWNSTVPWMSEGYPVPGILWVECEPLSPIDEHDQSYTRAEFMAACDNFCPEQGFVKGNPHFQYPNVINVMDIVTTVNMVLSGAEWTSDDGGNSEGPLPNISIMDMTEYPQCVLWSADATGDGIINVVDIVNMVNSTLDPNLSQLNCCDHPNICNISGGYCDTSTCTCSTDYNCCSNNNLCENPGIMNDYYICDTDSCSCEPGTCCEFGPDAGNFICGLYANGFGGVDDYFCNQVFPAEDCSCESCHDTDFVTVGEWQLWGPNYDYPQCGWDSCGESFQFNESGHNNCNSNEVCYKREISEPGCAKNNEGGIVGPFYEYKCVNADGQSNEYVNGELVPNYCNSIDQEVMVTSAVCSQCNDNEYFWGGPYGNGGNSHYGKTYNDCIQINCCYSNYCGLPWDSQYSCSTFNNSSGVVGTWVGLWTNETDPQTGTPKRLNNYQFPCSGGSNAYWGCCCNNGTGNCD